MNLLLDTSPTPAGSSVEDVLDHLLDQLQRRRERALRAAPSARQAAIVATLYEHEARAWSLLFERSQSRVHWRAALAAEAYARACARAWRARAHGADGHVAEATDLGGVWSS